MTYVKPAVQRFGSLREDIVADAKQWEFAMTLRAPFAPTGG